MNSCYPFKQFMNKWPLVSVVMSNYNGVILNLLNESLSSILNNSYPNLEVILIDNNSSDKSISFVKKKFAKSPRFKLIQNHINMYSLGLNLGVKNAEGKYIAFFNNDIIVEKDFFQKIIGFLEKRPEVVLAQGKLVSYYNPKIIDSAGETMDKFGNPTTLGQGLEASRNYNETMEILSVSGSCSIMRKSAIEKVGYFDDDYGIGYEDLDLALRVWLKGYKVIYYPKSLAFHKRAATDLSPMVRAIVRWHFNKNRLATLIKNYPFSFLIVNLPITILIYLLAGLWEIFLKRNFAIGITRFTAILWMIDQFPTILRRRAVAQKNTTKIGKEKIRDMLSNKILISSFLSFLKMK